MECGESHLIKHRAETLPAVNPVAGVSRHGWRRLATSAGRVIQAVARVQARLAKEHAGVHEGLRRRTRAPAWPQPGSPAFRWIGSLQGWQLRRANR